MVFSSPLSARGRIRHLCGGMGEDQGVGVSLVIHPPILTFPRSARGRISPSAERGVEGELI